MALIISSATTGTLTAPSESHGRKHRTLTNKPNGGTQRHQEAQQLRATTIDYQRQQAKAEALRKWEERWHAGPRTFLAYRTACTKPPDGKLHDIHHPDDEDGTRTFQGHKLPLATLLQRKCRESKHSLIIVFQ